jgi:exodeoxyribonuclease-3
MRLLTWNVNGLRAVLKKGFEGMMEALDADIVCLQETKAQADQIEVNEDLYPYQYISCAKRKGYSGTMVLSLDPAQGWSEGIGLEEHDQEGRVLTVDYCSFVLVNVYVPNSGEGLKRLEYRMAWDKAFAAYLKSIEKPLLVCGDFNAARTLLDVADPAWEGSAGFTPEERESFEANFSWLTDIWRHFHPDQRAYTWWSYQTRGRERDRGERIDYWLCTSDLLERVENIEIVNDIYGSDHCPVLLDIRL